MVVSPERSRRFWLFFILGMAVVAGVVSNGVSHGNVVLGAGVSLLLLFVPLGVEFLRGRDPLVYYGLDFDSLKRVRLGFVFAVSVVVFTGLFLVDYYVFDLWNLVLKDQSHVAVGTVTVLLARRGMVGLAVFIAFSGTLTEELWFRGLIQYKLNAVSFFRRVNPHFAVFTQAVLFGLVHFVPIFFGTDFSLPLKGWFFVYPCFVGVILGYLNERFDSLWPGWIVHFTNNVFGAFLLVLFLRG